MPARLGSSLPTLPGSPVPACRGSPQPTHPGSPVPARRGSPQPPSRRSSQPPRPEPSLSPQPPSSLELSAQWPGSGFSLQPHPSRGDPIQLSPCQEVSLLPLPTRDVSAAVSPPGMFSLFSHDISPPPPCRMVSPQLQRPQSDIQADVVQQTAFKVTVEASGTNNSASVERVFSSLVSGWANPGLGVHVSGQSSEVPVISEVLESDQVAVSDQISILKSGESVDLEMVETSLQNPPAAYEDSLSPFLVQVPVEFASPAQEKKLIGRTHSRGLGFRGRGDRNTGSGLARGKAKTQIMAKTGNRKSSDNDDVLFYGDFFGLVNKRSKVCDYTTLESASSVPATNLPQAETGMYDQSCEKPCVS